MGVGTTAIASIMHGRKSIGAEILGEYIDIAKDRIQLAEKGKLRIRPMDRPISDPNAPEQSSPPKTVNLNELQTELPGPFSQEEIVGGGGAQ